MSIQSVSNSAYKLEQIPSNTTNSAEDSMHSSKETVDVNQLLQKRPLCSCSHHEWQHTYSGRCLVAVVNESGAERKLCSCTKYTAG